MVDNNKFYFTLVFAFLFNEISAYPGKINSEAADDSSGGIRIVGGQNAGDGQFPWQVSLRRPSGAHFCGGSIIDTKWILTAAHCVAKESPSNITVVTGTNSLSYSGDPHQVSKIIVHSGFDIFILENDIALLNLETEITISDRAKPIPLETENVNVVDCIATGWGTTKFMGPVPDVLQFVDLKTISVLDCRLSLMWFAPSVTSKNVCTLTKSGEGTCHGDSGGPLVADGKLIGIVSWGNPCALDSPDVFTRVSSYVDWVNAYINKRG